MSEATVTPIVSIRKKEIADQYLRLLDQHIQELKEGSAQRTAEIKDFADQLNIHPRHLSNTIHEVLQQSPCSLYESRLLAISKELLLTSANSIASIARHLNYDPSNFSKFFKNYTGLTPHQFRLSNL